MANCELCGEPMPEGEEMFKFHGYSGPCPKPPRERPKPEGHMARARRLIEEHTAKFGPIPHADTMGAGAAWYGRQVPGGLGTWEAATAEAWLRRDPIQVRV